MCFLEEPERKIIMNENWKNIGFYPADILLPKNADMTKWAVVACDQFTSQPEYWQAVEDTVGEAPSTLRVILPEAKLNDPNVEEYITGINTSMKKYLEDDVFQTLAGSLIYIERAQSDGRIRHGLVGMVDLDQYDFTPGSGALIRATEGTVLERIPPRVKVRKDAPIELPHVMLLIDDPDRTVIEPLTAASGEMEVVYDFDLMQGGGHLRGWAVTAESDLAALHQALTALRDGKGPDPLLFAVGDGNHSLATAKSCYEALKAANPGMDLSSHPARYALVELENIHDPSLVFEPIHRILTEVDREKLLRDIQSVCAPDGHKVQCVLADQVIELSLDRARGELAVAVLQEFLDRWLAENPGKIDYIHGEDEIARLAAAEDAVGFLLPPMEKHSLFRGVIADGVLPRKTFSMGHAREKRYYLEGRKIK